MSLIKIIPIVLVTVFLSQESVKSIPKGEMGQLTSLKIEPTKSLKKPPAYMEILYDELHQEEAYLNQIGAGIIKNHNNGKVSRKGNKFNKGILPTKIEENGSESLDVYYNLTNTLQNQKIRIQRADVIMTLELLTSEFVVENESNSHGISLKAFLGTGKVEEQIPLKSGKFYKFDITSLLIDAPNSEILKITFIAGSIPLKSIYENEHPLVLFQFVELPQAEQSMIDAGIRTASWGRKKRAILTKPISSSIYNAQRFGCKYYDWFVEPKEVGLEHVIFPNLLDLGLCAGSCPFPLENEFYNFTTYSYFVDKYRMNKKHTFDVPKPSCTPTAFKPIMVLAYDPNTEMFYTDIFDQGGVQNCGCR